MSTVSSYPLRLPRSLKDAVADASRAEGTSINQFITLAVAEKLSALNTAEFFRQRAAAADLDAFDRIMSRDGGEPPCDGDALPDRDAH